jgi:hypothetical protein
MEETPNQKLASMEISILLKARDKGIIGDALSFSELARAQKLY